MAKPPTNWTTILVYQTDLNSWKSQPQIWTSKTIWSDNSCTVRDLFNIWRPKGGVSKLGRKWMLPGVAVIATVIWLPNVTRWELYAIFMGSDWLLYPWLVRIRKRSRYTAIGYFTIFIKNQIFYHMNSNRKTQSKYLRVRVLYGN